MKRQNQDLSGTALNWIIVILVLVIAIIYFIFGTSRPIIDEGFRPLCEQYAEQCGISNWTGCNVKPDQNTGETTFSYDPPPGEKVKYDMTKFEACQKAGIEGTLNK